MAKTIYQEPGPKDPFLSLTLLSFFIFSVLFFPLLLFPLLFFSVLLFISQDGLELSSFYKYSFKNLTTPLLLPVRGPPQNQ